MPAPFSYRLTTAEPAECAEQFAAGRAVAGLVPVAALPFLPILRTLPGLGIAARGAAKSVLLISSVPPEEIRTLAAHAASRTAVALARLLLAERWGVRPRVVAGRPPLEAMLAETEAAVLIGDPALHVHGCSGRHEVDLAGAWVEWTGLPFVFAVWAVGSGAPVGIDALLDGSLAYAREHWAELVPRWAKAHGVGREETRRYLEETLSYRLDDADRRGLQEFLRRASAAGVLPPAPRLWPAE